MEFLALLVSPIAGAAFLALFGARRWAPEANAAFSFATLIAAAALTVRVIGEGNITAAAEQFFIDPFNVFLVSLTAFVSFTTSLFSRPYMRIEREHGRVNAGQLRLYHSMYQLFIAAMLIALTSNNMGLVWVAMEAATLSTVLLVTLYRTPASLEAGWKYFILCGVGIAQALFGTILLYFAAEKVLGGEGMTALLWTHLNSRQGRARARGAEPRVRVPARRLRHEGRLGAAAQLAARRARRRPDADLRRAVGAAAERGDLRSRALQGARGRLAAVAAAVAHVDGVRPVVRGPGRVLSLAAARYQTPVRVLVHRAHGHHHVRVRHGRAGRELRGAAAHDRALADEVRHLLRRRPRRAESRFADHGRDSRADHAEPDRRLGA